MSFVLLWSFGFGGVIAAFSVSYTVVAAVALVTLQRRSGRFTDRELGTGIARQLIAAAAMGAALLAIVTLVGDALVALVLGVVAGALVYLGVLLLLRSRELGEMRTLVRRSPADPESAPTP